MDLRMIYYWVLKSYLLHYYNSICTIYKRQKSSYAICAQQICVSGLRLLPE